MNVYISIYIYSNSIWYNYNKKPIYHTAGGVAHSFLTHLVMSLPNITMSSMI